MSLQINFETSQVQCRGGIKFNIRAELAQDLVTDRRYNLSECKYLTAPFGYNVDVSVNSSLFKIIEYRIYLSPFYKHSDLVGTLLFFAMTIFPDCFLILYFWYTSYWFLITDNFP